MNRHAESVETGLPGDGSGVPRQEWRPLGAALAIGFTCYAGARIGLALTFEPFPLAVLWPPTALLLGALILLPSRWWWLLVLAAFPAHLLAESRAGVPAAMVFAGFATNAGEAVIGAALVRRFAGDVPGLGSLRAAATLCWAPALAAFLVSFLDAGFVQLVGWRDLGFWTLWQSRLVTNVLSALMVVPVAVAWAGADPVQSLHAGRARLSEAITLLTGLLVVGTLAFDPTLSGLGSTPGLAYLPLPLLLWAALRFGPRLTASVFTIVACLVVWDACLGHGVFLRVATHEDILALQIFLIAMAVPILLLAATTEERRRAERKLRDSEALFSAAFRSGRDAIALRRRRDGRIIEANACWLDLLRDEQAPSGTSRMPSLEEHVDAADRPRLASSLDATTAREVEVTLHGSRGQPHQALVAVASVQFQGEACDLTVVRDITAQRNAENEAREQRQQLIHLTRVASLTSFASTLAHELNQPLTAILSNAQAALRFLAREPLNVAELRSILAEIADADKRAGLLIHRLRMLMKKGGGELLPVDMSPLVAEVLEIAHGEFVTRGVEVAASLSPDLPQVLGDRVQLQQVVLNLISNACDAMRHQRSQPRKLSVTTALGPDDSVRLVVADSGPGIDAERLDRVFEPFYTTKDSGLGLGLAISRTIARAHGGSLSAESHDGHGATLRLTLPRATSARTAHASAPAVDVPAGQGEETLAERRHHDAETGGAEPGRTPTATAS